MSHNLTQEGSNPHKGMLKYLLSILLLAMAAQGENFAAATGPLPESPGHSFWSTENRIEFGVLGGLIAADAITTQQGLNQGLREMNPLMRPFVTRGVAGEAAGSALGFGAGLGVVYLFHRSHHYKAERITLHLIVGGEAAVVGNNIAELR
jgi:hypothetical protein